MSAVLKSDKYDWVIQKLTEIGVSQIQPVISERTEKQNLNYDRMRKIMVEASEQSEKIFVPKLHEIKKLGEVVEQEETEKFYLEISAPKINLSDLKSKNDITIFVGPEGGWGEGDLEIFSKNNVKPVSLGEQVLRAETASVAIATLLLLG